MTKEEKAKAYDEVLDRIKSFADGTAEVPMNAKNIAEYLAPELAESEDEDERIRKWLVDCFSAIKYPFWIHRDFTCEQILAWLEKQKENTKSSDSVPSDCVSDAKCEDRWHKVGDSLPDNPREVLCKDEAGNYFIGRYYVGEGWETSNYDDEDKPHHLNPPVSKWIDFPSEKQKEQRPAEWSEEDDAAHTRILGAVAKAFMGVLPTKPSKEDVRWLKMLPERFNLQRKQEWSEEDNIGWDEAFACVTRAEKAAKNEEELQNAVTAENWLKEIKFKYYANPVKQKRSEKEKKIFKLIEDVIRVYGKTQGKWIGGVDMDTLVVFLHRLRDNKSAEWGDNFEENIRNLLNDKLTWHSEDGSMSSTVFIDDKTLKDIISGIWFYVGKEAMKNPNREIPEWSDKDESYLQTVISEMEANKKEAREYEHKKYDTIILWLKSLRPQPHWKPSEEQMEVFFKANPINLMPEELVIYHSLYNDLKKLK